MADFERDIELLEKYSQWKAVNKGKFDTSPTAFMVEQAQQEAFEKLEKIERWFYDECESLSPNSREAFLWIMNGKA